MCEWDDQRFLGLTGKTSVYIKTRTTSRRVSGHYRRIDGGGVKDRSRGWSQGTKEVVIRRNVKRFVLYTPLRRDLGRVNKEDNLDYMGFNKRVKRRRKGSPNRLYSRR